MPSLGSGEDGPWVEVKSGGCCLLKVVRRQRTSFRSLVRRCSELVKDWILSKWTNWRSDLKSTTARGGGGRKTRQEVCKSDS